MRLDVLFGARDFRVRRRRARGERGQRDDRNRRRRCGSFHNVPDSSARASAAMRRERERDRQSCQLSKTARESRGGTGTHELVTFSKIQGLLENTRANTLNDERVVNRPISRFYPI